ncbi:hypothetical protein Tco_1118838 [Tanacetum coccineum]
MKEQAYNIIKTKDSRTQRQSNLNKSKESRFKISPQEFEDHTLWEIVSLKYVYEHVSSESAGSLALRKIVSLKITSDPDREVPVAETFHEQTDEELIEKEVKQMEGDDQAI